MLNLIYRNFIKGQFKIILLLVYKYNLLVYTLGEQVCKRERFPSNFNQLSWMSDRTPA